MESLPPVEVTRLLARARAGDAQAMGSAYSAVYDELKRAARLQLRRMQDNFEGAVVDKARFQPTPSAS